MPAETSVWCGKGELGKRALLAVVGRLGAPEPGWSLAAPLSRARNGARISFPDDEASAILFVKAPPQIEASSSEEEAEGGLTFDAVTCEEGRSVSFSADGLLGSEFHDGESIRVEGSFRADVTGPPEWWTEGG